MSLSNSEYRAKAALLALARQLQMLRRKAEKESGNVAANIIVEVAQSCLEDIHNAIITGKSELPALEGSSSQSSGVESPQAGVSKADSREWNVSTPLVCEKGISMAALVTLRADFESLKRKTDKEFGPDSVPSRILSHAIAELSHRLNRYFKNFR